MFETKTYESLLREKLERVDSSYDTREGSVIYDAMAPNSAETAQVYIWLDWMLNQMFGDTADREYLEKIAYDTRGIKPKEATQAVLKGKFNCPVETGSRFNLDGMNYEVVSAIKGEENTYRLVCETFGTEGNRHFGSMTPIEFIPGLTMAELTELLVPGEEEEDTEVFRQRWRASFKSLSFSGNKADYKEKIKKMGGVGGVKVLRATGADGKKKGGHVTCIVLGSDYRAPSGDLIQDIQTRIDPIQNAGEGDGLAPIGHEVSIMAVQEVPVSVETAITYQSGYSFEDIRTYIEEALDNYFLELNQSWEDTEKLVVRISQIESRLLEITGIVDATGTMLDGREENLVLGQDSIAVRGTFHG